VASLASLHVVHVGYYWIFLAIYGVLRVVRPVVVLICNCQLAVTSDSRIDSLLSLLIFILIVAFC